MSDPFGQWPNPFGDPTPRPPVFHAPPPPPPRRDRKVVWWTLGAVGVMAIVVAVTVALVLRSGTDPAPGPVTADSSAMSEPAAQETVGVVTDEPTCAKFDALNFDGTQLFLDFAGEIPPLPMSWTPEQRRHADELAGRFRAAADQTESFLLDSPNRAVRELYGQLIAQARTFADKLPSAEFSGRSPILWAGSKYGLAAGAAANALKGICSAVRTGDASRNQVPGIPVTDPPTLIADPANPQLMPSAPLPNCTEAQPLFAQFMQQQRPADMPERIIDFGERSGDPMVAYLATFAAQNVRAAEKSSTYSALNLPANWTLLLLQYTCEAVAAAP
ncbi:hypothetical protein [Mycobacterium sp. ACS4331]|uniref:hypothetical protein n=1 Tax=Mycobacterium sp. ACS4331 TaxID=1834121 RepID=UPI0007FF1EA8|nr:hypothetical protein [Mycobacterium sp. ACS4331]OBF11713.1 hypothetical protein A5727_19630 [Mycobacterium sp. ACS4331]